MKRREFIKKSAIAQSDWIKHLVEAAIFEVVAEALAKRSNCAEHEYSVSMHARQAAEKVIELLEIKDDEENDS